MGKFRFPIVYSLSAFWGSKTPKDSLSHFSPPPSRFPLVLLHLISSSENELGKSVAVNIAAKSANGDVSAVDVLGGGGYGYILTLAELSFWMVRKGAGALDGLALAGGVPARTDAAHSISISDGGRLLALRPCQCYTARVPL